MMVPVVFLVLSVHNRRVLTEQFQKRPRGLLMRNWRR